MGPPASSSASSTAASPLLRTARWAAFAALALFFLSMSIQMIWVADLWWQLRTGQWVVENGTVPTLDTLSYTATAHPWIELRWLYCLSAYIGWKLGGPALLILAQTAILIAAFTVLCWRERRALATLPGLGILALGIWAMSYRFVVRPELVSYLMIPLFLLVLEGAREGRFPRARWLLVPLQVLWTNSHTLFVFGPVLCWTFAAGTALARWLPRRAGGSDAAAGAARPLGARWDGLPALAALAAAVTAACWINPYFHDGATFPLLLFREIQSGSILGRTVGEFRSPFSGTASTLDLVGALALAAASAATFVASRRRLDPVRLLLWAAHVYLGAVAVRNIALFGLIATWASLRNLGDRRRARMAARDPGPQEAPMSATGQLAPATGSRHEAAEQGPPPGRSRLAAAGEIFRSGSSRHGATGSLPSSDGPRLAAAGHLLLAGALAFGSWYVVSGRYHTTLGCDPEFGLGVLACNTPAPATQFLLEAGASPQLFHAMADGSYLTWAARGRFPVFVDGRLEVYGEAFIEDYLNVAVGDWDGFARRHGINAVMVHREHLRPLLKDLRARPDWVLVHIDPRDLVYVRDIPEHAELIRRYRVEPDIPWRPRGPEPIEEATGWRRWIGAVEQPWYSYGMAQAFIEVESWANAATYLERARPHLAGDPAIDLTLAQLYAKSGQHELAAGAYHQAFRRLEPTAVQWCELAQTLTLARDLEGAAEAYQHARALDSTLYEAHYNLGVVQYRRGRLEEAAASFREALRLKPGDPDATRGLERTSPPSPSATRPR
jgi:tetratricopeptide (TPR) repeat protein